MYIIYNKFDVDRVGKNAVARCFRRNVFSD